MRQQKIFYFIIFFILYFSNAQADIYIIANRSVPVDEIRVQEIKEIFLGLNTTWNDKLLIKPMVLSLDPMYSEFLEKYAKKSKSQYKYWWRNMVFTGRGLLPKYRKTEENIIQIVAKTEGAIGFVSSAINNENVKTLSVKE